MAAISRQLWAAYRPHVFLQKPGSPGAWPGRHLSLGAGEQRSVEFSFGEQKWPRTRFEVQLHFRVLPRELRQPWNEPPRGKCGNRAQAQGATMLVRHHIEGDP